MTRPRSRDHTHRGTASQPRVAHSLLLHRATTMHLPVRSTSLLAIALLAAACGPSMNWQPREVQTLASSQRCAQGPFDLHLHTYGTYWGESITLRAHTDHAIRGHYQIEIADANVHESGTFEASAPAASTSTTSASGVATPAAPKPPTAGNAFCLAAQTSAVADSSGGAAPSAPDAPAAAPTIDLSAAPARPDTADVPTLNALASPTDGSPEYYYNTVIAQLRRQRDAYSLDRPTPPIPANADVHIRLWSDEPNDLQGVVFYLAHEVGAPSVNDAEYRRFLTRQRADVERTEREEGARAARRDAAWHAGCAAHHERVDCWGPGGYDGAVARMNHDSFCAGHPDDASCPRRQAPSPPPTVSIAVPEHHEPDGPPPPPRPETHPPQPSVHAAWVPGYWHWSGLAFGWIRGHWNVPDEDLAQNLTVHAPSAPPPVRVEAPPPPPVAQAVWTAGYWQWNGQGFVWVEGSWQLPPSAAARWRPAGWTPSGVQVVFDPGRWF